MIYGLGVDITEIKRIEQAVKRQPRFVQRVLTPAEQKAYHELGPRRQAEYLAGRFSGKESFVKALGTGFRKIDFQDIEILNDELGKPVMTQPQFSGNVQVSISHTQQLVMTEVILEREAES